ncbi:response regulator transcription factor [Lentilactobacillus kisonensis]|uniref:Response regulator receiver domain protein n=2 Tax=Lentilactobacillus kisonensis TaxID=481722 RepID=H1LI06_9LACO|nr:response regulator transcription factor [Lentilactobacillus kisonensis]EHO50041.1 response regulator receiver domain protein [Lentilactobacillus kisonensis F0435]KRL22189.1 response regulator receiver domain protein [Lentilactobacillus kisonensis DSM 19906 = JCM 15041]
MTNTKILIVEDHRDVRDLLRDVLANDYQVVEAVDGVSALAKFNTEAPDLIILDLMLPQVTGESVLKTIRKTSAVPVLVLTAIQDKQKVVALLEEGANDYLTKPFDIDELLARVQVQLRQRTKPLNEQNKLTYGAIVLNPSDHQVVINGQKLPLPKKEFAILQLLLAHPKQVFTKENLYETVWGEPYLNAENTLNVHISNLRNKVNDLAGTPNKYIISIWGIGVRLV